MVGEVNTAWRLLSSYYFGFFEKKRGHTRCSRDWSSDVCSSDLVEDLRHLLYLEHILRRLLGVRRPRLFEQGRRSKLRPRWRRHGFDLLHAHFGRPHFGLRRRPREIPRHLRGVRHLDGQRLGRARGWNHSHGRLLPPRRLERRGEALDPRHLHRHQPDRRREHVRRQLPHDLVQRQEQPPVHDPLLHLRRPDREHRRRKLLHHHLPRHLHHALAQLRHDH